MTEKPDLEPCPLCGKKAFYNADKGFGRLGGQFYREIVRCRRCTLMFTARHPNEAVNAWNKRAKEYTA